MNGLILSSNALLLCAMCTLYACDDNLRPEPAQGSGTQAGALTGEPSAGEPSAGEPSAGEPSAGEPSAGEPSAGEQGGALGGSTSTPPPTTEELLRALSERGPHPVGYLTEQLSYEVPARGDERTLKLAWWFPSASADGRPVTYGGGSSTRFAQQGVEVDAQLREAPVLVFSHGNGGIAEQSYFLTEHFASHGWVVLAVEHTGNTLTNQGEAFHWMFELRPRDISASLDHLAALPSEHPLAGHISQSDWALSGHSFGGYTTLALAGARFDVDTLTRLCASPPPDRVESCEYTLSAAERYREGFGDPRFKALIPMTPAGAALFSRAGGLSDLSAPVMMMTAALDATLPNSREGDPLWEGLTSLGDIRVDFASAGHFTFSNACEVARQLLEDDGCGERFLPYEQAHQLINLYALAFARQHTLGDERMASITQGLTLPELAAGQLTFSVRE